MYYKTICFLLFILLHLLSANPTKGKITFNALPTFSQYRISFCYARFVSNIIILIHIFYNNNDNIMYLQAADNLDIYLPDNSLLGFKP